MYNKERVDFLLLQDKTREVVDELVRLNTGLVNVQLFKFYLVNDPDAISLAYEALYNAILTYTPGRSAFSTYATVCIYNRLGSYVRSLNTNLQQITVLYENQINEEGTRLIDVLESPLTADGNVLAESGVNDIRNAVISCYEKLTNPLHKKIIAKWVNSDFCMTHASIGESLGCTQTYVSQTIKRFKQSIKEMLE